MREQGQMGTAVDEIDSAAASADAAPAERRPRLTYVPALDGLRGLAVAAVLAYHAGYSWAKGGFLGVSLFFTLSGYLITSLVLAERQDTGRVNMPGFWARRLRRLMPASTVALLLALVAVVVAVPTNQQAAAVGDVRAALLDVSNWRFIVRGTPYVDAFHVPSPVQHYWSLSIEEQFYLLFPIVAAFTLRRRPAVLAWCFGTVVLVSFAGQLLISGHDRVYFGTDTRAAELAIGGLLAIGLPWVATRGARQRRRVFDVVGSVALVVTFALWWLTSQQSEALERGGFTAIAVVSALLVAGAVAGLTLPRALGTSPLVGLGKISYGVYLYHFPLYLILDSDRTGLDGNALTVVRWIATLAAAMVSYHALERPIRTARVLSPTTARISMGLALAGVLAISVLVAPAGKPALAITDRTLLTAAQRAALPVVPGGSPAPTPRIVVVGDSTAHVIGEALTTWGTHTGRLESTSVFSNGCAVAHGDKELIRNGYEFVPEGCDDLFTRAAVEAEHSNADAIVAFMGSAQVMDWHFAGEDGWQHIGTPAFDDRYRAALDASLRELERVGLPIMWADLPTLEWDVDVFAHMLGTSLPGTGKPTGDDPARVARLNTLDREVIAHHPAVRILAFAEHIQRPDGTVDPAIRPDGLHLAENAVGPLADSWLMGELDRIYDAIVADPQALLVTPRAQLWSIASG